MKRMLWIIALAALLCACASVPAEPVIEPDARASAAPIAAETTKPAEVKETEAPATEAPATEAPEAEQTFAQRVAAAWAEQGLLDGMAPYPEDDLLDLYGIDLADCISGAGFCETAGYVREAVLIETDEATAIEIEALLSEYLEARKEQFVSYDPEAYAIAQQAVLERSGGTVLFVISPDADAMKTAFDALLP